MADQPKDHVAGLAIQIPESLIRQTIMAEVSKALPPERIVAEVVRVAMSQKQNTYDKTTIFENQIAAEIRDLCKAVFREWLAEQKDKIREQLLKELERGSAKRVKDIATQLASGLSTISIGGISLAVLNPRD